MRYNRIILIFGMLILCMNGVWGQAPQLTAEEIQALKKLAEYSKTWNAFLNIWAILGPLLAVIVTYFGLKNRVEKWAEDEITKKANEKFGVDWVVVKQLVDNKKHDIMIKEKRLAIVNKQTGRRQDFVATIEKSGFKKPPQFFNLVDFTAKFDHNQFDLIILDNYDGQLTETEMRQIIGAHQFPYVLFTNTQLSQDFFNDFNGKVKFAKIQENVPDYIAQSF